MRIALVEPYYGGSHKAWADGYAASSLHDVSLVTHDARFWKWRMHGGFFTLAEQLAQDIALNGVPDVILASSMMNVSAFAGAVRHVAQGVPIAVFFHESQFTYPLSPADRVDFTYKMINWVSAATADLVIFNSAYHRDVFRDEAKAFLNSFPEHKHVDEVDRVMSASLVLPVGVDLSHLNSVDTDALRSPLIVWNQRWEHDKGPAELKAILRALIDADIDFSVAMCGDVFVSVPPEFAEITDMVGDRLVHEGWLERDAYIGLLKRSSVVLSTAHQEFFGIAIVEAIAAGAHPVLPDRLVYPERVGQLGADPDTVLYSSTANAVELIRSAFDRTPDERVMDAAQQYDWSAMAPRYDDALEKVRGNEVGR
jgi:glycosyltransferase involved in cell wall biosynthesis